MAGDRDQNGFFNMRSGRTALQFIVASIIVGAVFSFFGVGPQEFWRGVFSNVRNIIASLGESFGEIILTLVTYLVIGAAIVLPVWLVARLLTNRK